jgi:hypothetical protein
VKAEGIQETLSDRVPEPWVVLMPEDLETGLADQETDTAANTRSRPTSEDGMELLSHRANIAGRETTSTQAGDTYRRLYGNPELSDGRNSEDQAHGTVPRSLTV